MTKRLKLKAGKRAFAMMAGQAIGNDLLKGLIELITNADESYARLAETGIDGSGKIEIELDRRTRTKQTVVSVVDYAEGMDENQMESVLQATVRTRAARSVAAFSAWASKTR